tara:strand:+ start:4321 stop:4782 length:462 start_codon:yes stop_codon:yes gene_type:complete
MALSIKKTCIVVADGAKARIFNWNPIEKHIQELMYLQEEDARKPERDLRADRPGSGQGFNSKIQYTVDEHLSYKKQASQLFLEKIAKLLCEKDNLADFDILDIIAPDEVYKSILKHMSVSGRNKINNHYPKNLTNMPVLDLQKHYAKLLSTTK